MKLGETNVAKTIERLPQELIVDILSRFPAIFLWPLRCVCKTWYKLITKDPQFAKSVFDRSVHFKSNPSSILAWGHKSSNEEEIDELRLYFAIDHTECDNAIELNIPFLSHDENIGDFLVYGISNGMLCLSHRAKNEVYIWNPLTNDHITIPCPTPPQSGSKGRILGTVFGFGYVESTNEYKVIGLGECANEYKVIGLGKCRQIIEYCSRLRLSVYTLGKDSCWRTVGEDIPFGISFKNVPCPQINGHVYWLARSAGHYPVSTAVGFDLKDELLYEIDHTPIAPWATVSCLQELDGLLSLFNATVRSVDAWTMKQNGGEYSWTKLFTIIKPESVETILKPLGVVAHGEDIILVHSMGLITYNKNTKSINHLKDFGFLTVKALAYFGSIISPRAISGAEHIGI